MAIFVRKETLPIMKIRYIFCLAFAVALSATLLPAQKNSDIDEIIKIEDHLERTVASTDDPGELYRAYYRTAEFYYHHGSQNIALDYFLAAAPYATTDKERSRIYYAIGIASENIAEASAGIALFSDGGGDCPKNRRFVRRRPRPLRQGGKVFRIHGPSNGQG